MRCIVARLFMRDTSSCVSTGDEGLHGGDVPVQRLYGEGFMGCRSGFGLCNGV